MKTSALLALVLVCLVFFSCKKNTSAPSHPSPGKTMRIQSSGTNLSSKILLVIYSPAGNILSVNDSANGVIYTASYDPAGNLTHIVQMNGTTLLDSASYSYNAQDQMIGRVTSYINTTQVTTFYYAAGVLAADSTYYFDSGNVFDSSYTTYQVSNGDIASFQLTEPGNPIDSVTLTHSSSLNPFRQLSLFNWTQGLENIDVASPYTWFDQHALAGYTNTSQLVPVTETATYTFNTAGEPIEAKSVESFGATSTVIFDWVITYP